MPRHLLHICYVTKVSWSGTDGRPHRDAGGEGRGAPTLFSIDDTTWIDNRGAMMRYFAQEKVHNLRLEAAGNGFGAFCKQFYTPHPPASRRRAATPRESAKKRRLRVISGKREPNTPLTPSPSLPPSITECPQGQRNPLPQKSREIGGGAEVGG